MATKKAATKKSAAKKSAPKKTARRSTTPPSRRWSAKVKTDSTKPAPGLFKKSGKAIAEGLAKKSVSPEGPGQAMRMLNFYENRGGHNLSGERIGALEQAKRLLHKKVEAAAPTKKSAGRRSAAKKTVGAKASSPSAAKKSAKKASR